MLRWGKALRLRANTELSESVFASSLLWVLVVGFELLASSSLVCLRLGRFPGRLHDLLQRQRLAQVAAHLDLTGHKRGRRGKLA